MRVKISNFLKEIKGQRQARELLGKVYRGESKDRTGICKTGQKMLPAFLKDALYLRESLHMFDIANDDAYNSSRTR